MDSRSISDTSQSGKEHPLSLVDIRSKLLNWYDNNKRILPWRATKNQTIAPYYTWLSEIMLQQTVVKTVMPYFEKFIQKWPDIHALAQADRDEVMKEWAGLGYYARARNLHKCAQIVSNDYEGIFPQDLKTLKTLPGIGDYTSAAIAAIAFGKQTTVVDGNVERVMARYFSVEEPLPDSKKTLKAHAEAFYTGEGGCERLGDLAQALMDLGATVCIAKTPRCALCPLQDGCGGRKTDYVQDLPRKRRKKARPFKKGYAYILCSDQGQCMLERRPNKDLLGGMLGFPVSEWVDQAHSMPAHPDWLANHIKGEADMVLTGTIYHTFTHFDLRLDCYRIKMSHKDIHDNKDVLSESLPYDWYSLNSNDLGLPSLFEKVRKTVLA